ncbi:MAG: 2,3-bisphosphoglycerate-independent phosphoglycerate mutase [Patescibacteria group bacterium]|nr:2,3-bisphosphoglycerate-independent phosphoglycerate mutase [Patescibacteria group bacterium]
MAEKYKKAMLVIMDGVGISEETKGNAVKKAKTPFWDNLWRDYPHGVLQASGEAVGLNWGEMGGSEVGHMNIGSGRVVYQSLPRINRAIMDGTFFTNEALMQAIAHAKKYESKIHLIGLLSPGGVHSTIEHLHALLRFLKQSKIKKDDVCVHGFTDGRDAPSDSGLMFLRKLEDMFKEVKIGKLVSLIGRYYAMDRDERWERTVQAYNLLVQAQGEMFKTGEEALKKSYEQKITDEFVTAKVIAKKEKDIIKIEKNDVVIFYNFRADRARQLTKAFVSDDFKGFERSKISNLFFVTMMKYDDNLPVNVVFEPQIVKETLAEVVSRAGLKQLHIAETEKFPHVTFFFNGGQHQPFKNEDQVKIPSPRVATYDLKPEMSADKVTEKIIQAIKKDDYSFIVVNYANGDMVGHTADFKATVKALEFLDKCLSQLIPVAQAHEFKIFFTADHGNCEEMISLQSGKKLAEHSNNPVPFVVVDEDKKPQLGEDNVIEQGVLADVAPTILNIMGLKVPEEMTGRNLLVKRKSDEIPEVM